MITTPSPWLFRRLTSSSTWRVCATPSAAVGSSRMTTREFHMTARATATDWRCPPESVATRCRIDLTVVTASDFSVSAVFCSIAGSFSPSSWFGPHPENLSERFFDAAVENARRILDAVKPTRTTFCYEMMAWSLPDSADASLRMLKAVDRRAFAVHLDPCNLVNSPDRYYRSSDLVRECYAKLGPHVASVHAKDLTWDVEMAVHFREVRIGQGSIDHGAWLAEHARHCPDVPLMLEHLSGEAEYDAARDHVRAAGESLGLRFE